MQIKAYKTHPITEQESIFLILDRYLPPLEERSIVVVTSKIVSICEGQVIAEGDVPCKEALIRKSADAYLAGNYPNPHAIQLTIKNNILIPSAGIDASNSNGNYIFYPKDIQRSAVEIWKHLREKNKLKEVGVIISDSHTTPMRRGVLGIGLGWCGFKPLYNYVGKPDCFGRPLRVTQSNIVDAMAVSAVFCMGEGDEQTPLAVITNAPKMEFQSQPPTQDELKSLIIPMEEDLYAPLLQNAPWACSVRF